LASSEKELPAALSAERGDDTTYTGKEICFASNENTLTIIDVTNKDSPVEISRTGYDGVKYTHQGWLTEDHNYFILGDELDEKRNNVQTTTYVFNVKNLNSVSIAGIHTASTQAIDHNQYVKGNYLYQANYRAGLRILEMTNIAAGEFNEVAYFDIYPDSDSANFNGAWSVYPYFESGTIIVSGIEQGLYVLKKSESGPPSTRAPTRAPSKHPTTAPTRTPESQPPSSCRGSILEIDIVTDNYGSETSWKLKLGQTTAASALVGEYESTSPYKETLCLKNGDYNFIIEDTFGDGICCSEGEGSYALSLDSKSMVTGGSFRDADYYAFTVGDSPPTPKPTVKQPPTSCSKYTSNKRNCRTDKCCKWSKRLRVCRVKPACATDNLCSPATSRKTCTSISSCCTWKRATKECNIRPVSVCLNNPPK